MKANLNFSRETLAWILEQSDVLGTCNFGTLELYAPLIDKPLAKAAVRLLVDLETMTLVSADIESETITETPREPEPEPYDDPAWLLEFDKRIAAAVASNEGVAA